ncbi:MAG: class I SAM-dependent methyltransferase [Bacteroidales bacterium]|nr:class I SAM-dependent methyltransferase [Bacteroidales bacterium]MBN2820741.1 class I SAM-dependent methyltransferase [Bacteroidales bacterium]
MKTSKRTEKFWDMLSSKTDKIAMKFEQTYSKAIERTKNYLKSDDIVLDFACGTGLVCNEIASKVAMIHAVDISSKMIEIANSKAINRRIDNIKFEKISIFDEKFNIQQFDVVLAFNILHLLKDSDNTIARIYELLKVNGYFITSTECAGENKRAPLNILVFILIKLGIAPYMRFYKTKEIEKQIINCGFRIIETESYINHNQPNYFIVAQKIDDKK